MAATSNPTQRRKSIQFAGLEARDDGLDLVDNALAVKVGKTEGPSMMSKATAACRQRVPKFMLHKTLAPYFEQGGAINNLPGDISAGIIVAGEH